MGFDQGLSGLNGAAKNLDVIGNNIANSTTVGFKASRIEFADVYASSLFGVSNLTVGIGSKVSAVSQQFTQGNVSVTNNPLDLAISGQGFFQMDQNGLITYTRNGQLHLDASGFIVDAAGRKLTGNLAANGVVIGGPPVDLKVTLGLAPPNLTTTSQLTANLDSTSPAPNTGTVALPVVPAIAPANPATYNFSTTFTVYDTAGTAQGLTLYFQKDAITSSKWNVVGFIGNNQVLPANPTPITFKADGTVNTINGFAPGVAGSILTTVDTTGIAAPNTGTMPSFSLDLTKMTQYGTTSGVSFVTQNGFSAGVFAGLSVDKSGLVQGRYTNGQTLTLGQILMTNFLNPNGLQPLGDNQWAETTAAGKQNSGAPGSGVLGNVQSGAVEDSNVDLTAELVNLIVAQRQYQANAQSVKAQDTILQTLVSL